MGIVNLSSGRRRPDSDSPSESKPRDVFIRLGEFLSQWWPNILSGLGGLLMVLAQLADSTDHITLVPGKPTRAMAFWPGLSCFILGSVFLALRQPRTAELERRVRTIEQQVTQGIEGLRALRRNELSLLAKQLHFYSAERISLFGFQPDGFVLIARHALNTRFEAAGRPHYPVGEGCIGLAWEDGFAAATDLPDPATHLSEWQKELLDRYQVPVTTSQAIIMKSRACIAFRIETGAARLPVGVVVFESQNLPDTSTPRSRTAPMLDPDELTKVIKGAEGIRLQCMLECATEIRH